MSTDADAATVVALRALSERYARGVDRRDAGVFLEAFCSEGRLRVFNPGDADEARLDLRGHGQLARVTESIGAYDKTFHLLGNAHYDVADGEAEGEVYCVAHHLTRDRHGGTTYVMYIRYVDRYRRVEGRWGIEDRRVLVDWTETRTANPGGR